MYKINMSKELLLITLCGSAHVSSWCCFLPGVRVGTGTHPAGWTPHVKSPGMLVNDIMTGDQSGHGS